MQQHELTGRQFGPVARNYLSSPVHASGADLERLTELSIELQVGSALDLGCGAGHAAYALARAGVERVVAFDLSQAMLDVVAREAATRQHDRLETILGVAEALPFADASFDLVVTRYSAHHWLDVERALSEATRVLKPGGRFVAIDVIAPADPLLDTVLQTLEFLRDGSHVRDYREAEWLAMLGAAHLRAQTWSRWKLPMEFGGWIERSGTEAPRVAARKVVIDALPSEARAYFCVARDHSFAIDSACFEGSKI
jgi:ubiquinone/menaquinone biosynthesis C-methylase UbiE